MQRLEIGRRSSLVFTFFNSFGYSVECHDRGVGRVGQNMAYTNKEIQETSRFYP